MRFFRCTWFGAIAAISAAPMLAACGSSTNTVTAPSTIERCGVTLGASDATVPADGGTGRITITTARECAWSAAPEVAWLGINGIASGQGDGSIEFRVASNADPALRRGAIVVNNQRAEITQAAGTCVLTLRQHSGSFPQAGGNGSIDVSASSSLCTWVASADADWVRLTSSANGKGSAAVNFSVSPTSGPPRTATISIADQRYSVTQAEGCSYTIAPVSYNVAAAGGTSSLDVQTAGGCPWTSLSNVPWVTVTSGASGSGSDRVTFTVAPTDGPERSGLLIVAGQPFTVNQTNGCSFQVSPLSHNAPGSGGTLQVTVAASPGCGWTAASSASWIMVMGAAAGNGNGTVTFSIAASTGPARNGTLVVAGSTITVAQGTGCTFAISPESATAAATGGIGSVTVNAPGGCAWSAASQADWITITRGSSGNGNGTVQYSVAPAQNGARSGTIAIADRTFTVNQSEPCSFTLSPESASVPVAGGPASFNVQSASTCAWTAASNVDWITVSNGSSGTGSGAVQLTVAANGGGPRTGTVTAGGRTFTVNQQGSCSFTLSTAAVTIPAAGGASSVDVAGDSSCSWTAVPQQDWIAITSGASGIGSGTVQFTVAPNAGPARTGQIVIGDRTLAINQADGCSFAIAPQQQDVPAGGAEVRVTVSGSASCGWTALANVGWISIIEGASGTGSGTVRIGVAASTEPARTGTATIAGQPFTVNQASGCTYELSPPSRVADAAGGAGSFNVTTSGACPWTAIPDVPWITITAGSSGAGTGKVDYSLEPNAGPARMGTITVQGKTFTVNQAGI